MFLSEVLEIRREGELEELLGALQVSESLKHHGEV